MFSTDQFSLIMDDGFILGTSEESFRDVIIDRKSHYSVTGIRVASREEADIAMKKLLQDLELVLAQVARLPKSRQQDEMSLITNALEERDLVPRLRSAVADLAGRARRSQ